MKKVILGLLPLTLFALTFNVAASQYLHTGPWTFLFGNHLDTHQESKLKQDGSLQGRLYVIFTGDVDPVTGWPVARHPRGAKMGEECGVDPIDCVVGLNFKALPGTAKFLFHSGVNGDDHAAWLVNRAEQPELPGGTIPNPGAFTHFHWITRASTDDRALDVSDDCDKVNAGQLETDDPVAVNDVCLGWFMELQAIREFAFQHGGELIPVSPGIDTNSHSNILTNYRADLEITPTRHVGHE